MTLKTDLIAVRELLSVPERWTKGEFMRDEAGSPTVSELEARAYCLTGAILKRDRSRTFAIGGPVYQALYHLLDGDSCALCSWNDAPERTHSDILSLLDKAIEAAE